MPAGGFHAVGDFDPDAFDELIDVEPKYPCVSPQIGHTLDQLIS